MAFVKNDSQQLSFTSPLYGLTDREKRILDKSWATQFAERIFPLIEEEKFSVLYSDKASRPPITSWQIDGETMETMSDLIFLGSKVTVDGD